VAPGERGATSQPAGASETPISPRGGVKRVAVAIQGDPKTLNSKVNSAGAGSVPGVDALERFVNSGLVVVANAGEVRAQLAVRIPSLENGLWVVFPDGRMTTTWNLRPGPTWHDGTPATSADVLFTSIVERDRETPAFRDAAYASVESVEAPDPQTVVVKWRSPYIEADRMFEVLLPRHLLERPYGEDKVTFLQIPYWTESFIGNGPFKLREWARGSHLILDAYDPYVLGRARIDEIEVKFIPDSNTLIANLLAGSVEVTIGRSLSLEQAIQVRDQWRDGRVDIYPQLLNPTPAVVADLSLRRALLHATDRQKMADELMAGYSAVAHVYMNPREPEYREIESRIVRYDYDPRRAAQLIEGLGFTRGADGFYRDGAGQRLSVEVRAGLSLDIQTKSLFALAEDWQRAGVGVEPVVVPPQQATDRQYRATRPAFEVVRQPNSVNSVVRAHGAETPLAENSFTGANRTRYRSTDFDALLDRYVATIPQRDRMIVLGQIVHHITDQVVWLGLFHDTEATMIGNRLRNVTARSQSSAQTWNAHEWDVG
jgi:peptide/nickel transport system substrate-binding protein